MSLPISRYCDSISNDLLEALKMGAEHGTEELQEYSKEVEKRLEKLCKLETLYSNELNAVTNHNFEDPENIDKEFKKVLAECEKMTSENAVRLNPRYTQVKREMEDIAACYNNPTSGTATLKDPEMQQTFIDEDIQMATQLKFIDPITKQLIQNPYRNRICSHVYEHKTILEAIRMNPRLRCPYLGCGNKNALKEGDLREDRELKIQIMKNLRLTENPASDSE